MTAPEMPARALQRRRLLHRGVYLLDRHFIRRKERYLFQAALAAVALAAVLAVESTLSKAIFTAIASSAFIIFTVPHSRQSSPRRVIGGHAVGVVVGLLAAVIVHDLLDKSYDVTWISGSAAAIAVGAGILVMAATDTEHPPAAGTILGLTLAPDALLGGLLVIVSAAALSAIRTVFRRWLIDLVH
jgi:CBS-domain-containing membrane protein